MHARKGDHIVIAGHWFGEPDRDGEVLEVRGPDGGPPYLVRWGESEDETLLFPHYAVGIRHAQPPSTELSEPR